MRDLGAWARCPQGEILLGNNSGAYIRGEIKEFRIATRR
jgi:hypothetical protein